MLDKMLRDTPSHGPDQEHIVECYFNCGTQTFHCKRIDDSGHHKPIALKGVHAYLLGFGTERPFTLYDVVGLTDSILAGNAE
jgi:hypothetical protein